MFTKKQFSNLSWSFILILCMLFELSFDNKSKCCNITCVYIILFWAWDILLNRERFVMNVNHLEEYYYRETIPLIYKAIFLKKSKCLERLYVKDDFNDVLWREIDYSSTIRKGSSEDIVKNFIKNNDTCDSLLFTMLNSNREKKLNFFDSNYQTIKNLSLISLILSYTFIIYCMA